MKATFLSIVVAGLMIPAALWAQPPGEPDGKRPPEDGGPRGPGGFERAWKRADVDGSGTISREEFGNMPRIQKLPEEKREKIFKRLDKDGDGILSAEELKMMGVPGQLRKEAMMRFKELDTDRSGGISLEELKASELFAKLPPDKQEALFKRLDTNGDGQITGKDRPQPPPPGGPDHPGGPDGGNRPDPRRMLRELDENHDGAVSFEEFRKAPPVRNLTQDEQEDRFEALDHNGDQKLDEKDFPPLPPPPEDAPPPPGE